MSPPTKPRLLPIDRLILLDLAALDADSTQSVRYPIRQVAERLDASPVTIKRSLRRLSERGALVVDFGVRRGTPTQVALVKSVPTPAEDAQE